MEALIALSSTFIAHKMIKLNLKMYLNLWFPIVVYYLYDFIEFQNSRDLKLKMKLAVIISHYKTIRPCDRTVHTSEKYCTTGQRLMVKYEHRLEFEIFVRLESNTKFCSIFHLVTAQLPSGFRQLRSQNYRLPHVIQKQEITQNRKASCIPASMFRVAVQTWDSA